MINLNSEKQLSYPLRADLHFHTRFSDGKFSPEDIIKTAAKNGLEIISITDHDTVKGIPEMLEAAQEVSCRVLPGVELEAFVREDNNEFYPVHILGYGINHENKELLDFLSDIKKTRVKRAKKMLEKLTRFGIKLDFEAVNSFSRGESVGRVHVAQALKEADYVKTVDEAFQLYIGDDLPAYESKPHYSPQRVIDLIHDCAGMAVWAHPYYTNNDAVIEKLTNCGLDGLECYHHEFEKNITEHYLKLADEYDLIVTGGSDFHGTLEEDFEPGDWFYEAEQLPLSTG